MKKLSLLIGAVLCAVLCSFSGAQRYGTANPDTAVSAELPTEAPAEPVTEAPSEPAAEPPAETPDVPDKYSAVTNEIRRQRIAAEKLTGLELPMNYPAQAQHITVTNQRLRNGCLTDSGTSSYTLITDKEGSVLGTLGEGGFSLYDLYEYGEDGSILRDYSMSYGSVSSYQEKIYRDDGSVSENVLYGRDDDGIYRPESYTEFDSEGNITSEGYCHGGGRTSSRIVVNTYDDSGDLVLSESYQAYDVTLREKREYDDGHRLLLETQEFGDDHLVTRIVTEYTYLKSGSLKQKTSRSYDKDGEVYTVTCTEYTYDEQGRITSETVRCGTSTVTRKEFEYEELNSSFQ